MRSRDIGAGDICEEVLKRLRIIGKIQTLIAKMGDNHFDHKGFEPEAVPLVFYLPRPKFDQANDLSKVLIL